MPGQAYTIAGEAVDISRYASRLYQGKTALVDYDDGASYSYRDLDSRAQRIAGFLADVGVGRGDRVAYILANRVECIDLFNASSKVGAVLAPISWRLTPSDIARVLRDLRPKLLVYEEQFAGLVREALSRYDGSLERLVVDSELGEGEYGWSDAMKSRAPPPRLSADLEETRMILYTGGTTGFPKPALISARQVLFNVFSEILTWRLHHRHRTVLMLPLFHTGGWNLLTLPLLAVGGLVYLTKRFDPSKVLEVVETEEGPFVLFGVPTMYYMIAKTGGFREARFESVEWMLSGGSFIDRRVMEWYWEKGVKLAQGYGSTEAGPNNLTMLVHDLTLEEIRRRWRSVGKPFAFNQVFVVDDSGRPLGPGEYGELVICGPLVFSGYLGLEDETRKTLRDECVYTGDIAYYDDEGFYYIVDRKKDVIKTGGEQVYPREVEDTALTHPKVEDAAVIGVPDPKWGEAVKLIVKPKPGVSVSKEELLGFLRERLPGYKVPKYIAIADSIPRSPTGKVLRRLLRERYGSPRDDL